VLPNDEQAYAAVTSPGFAPRSVAVTHEPAPGVPERTAGSAAPPGTAQISDYEDERVVVKTNGARNALLVLTDSWAPGWKASIDGNDADVQRVDYLIRGVAVPAGEHTVEFRYQPATWRWGWAISLITLLGLAAAALVGWRRARRGA
jgi:Bacterial membrane protein YfhO